jgi:hypothetical protein
MAVALLTLRRSAHDKTDAKAISPVTNVAAAMLDDGTNIANNVAEEANALTSTSLAVASGLTEQFLLQASCETSTLL